MLGSRRRVLLVLAVTATLGAMTLFAGAMGATCPGKPGCGDCAFAELLLQLRDDFGASTLTVHVADQSSASDFTAARLRVTWRVGRDTRSAEVNLPQLRAVDLNTWSAGDKVAIGPIEHATSGLPTTAAQWQAASATLLSAYKVDAKPCDKEDAVPVKLPVAKSPKSP